VYKCDTPYCKETIPVSSLKKSIKGRFFCDSCRAEHSLRVLLAQADHELPITEVLMEASSFQSAGGMSDYLGVSFVTVYNWISKYFKMTFQEFRRQHICKKASRDKCYILDIRRSSYSRHDYVLKKIRSRRYCACINILDDSLIMTNAPLSVIKSILRGSPRIERINDDTFALVPDPIKEFPEKPVYFDQIPLEFSRVAHAAKLYDQAIYVCDQCGFRSRTSAGLSSHNRISHSNLFQNSPLFFEKILIVLYNAGNCINVRDLVSGLTTSTGGVPRKNNTRREVYRRPDLLCFDDLNSQLMRLTAEGLAFVETDLKPKYPHFFNN
jgi:hypothetical protein